MKKLLIRILTIVTVVFSVFACDHKGGSTSLTPAQKRLLAADSIARYTIYSTDRRIFYQSPPEQAAFVFNSLYGLIDSLEKCGDLTEMVADELRGELFSHAGLNCEEAFSRVIAHERPTDLQQWHYKTAGNILAYELYMRHNYEGFLRVAVPLVTWMDSLDNSNWKKMMKLAPSLPDEDRFSTWGQKMNLYSLLGCCYLKLEQRDKAKEVLEQFHRIGQEALAEDSTRIAPIFVNTYARVKDAYVRIREWEEVRKWMARTDTLGYLYAMQNPESNICRIYDCYSHLDIAIKLWSLGDKDSAAVEYAKFKESDVFNTLNARIQANDYLVNAECWADAAENYEYLDYFINKPWLEEISAYYMPKLRANYYAGRRDSALSVAMQIAELFDSAYVWQKQSQMAEMATIYDTQGKEMQIARQQVELSQERLWGTAIALVLLTIFFVIYTFHRRRAQQRLAAAHVQLQAAYDQLEETTTAKERIESELRIARNIQMSMVPAVFPQLPGLDMYAEMIPAKEVGGDLYGYILQGERLYFCVGDVSGKGVPASLFMAQVSRLFRTFATEDMMPADIAMRMNNELTEGNDNNMFVTLFIGLLHLDTGRLDYCNCGHNAPIIDGQFLQMKYVNMMIGVWEGTSFYGETIDDIRGKQLLIYTDGLNEAENPQHELLGNDRLIKLMSEAVSLHSNQVIDMLEKAVAEHRAGVEPNDDLTLMCLRLVS